MKRIIILFWIVIGLSGCEDFLDTTDLVRKNSDNFPMTRTELDNALTGAYAKLCDVAGQNDCPFFWGTIISDECFGNGGSGDHNWQSKNQLLRIGENAHSGAWNANYTGIFRCNSIFQAMETNPDIAFPSTEDRNQFLGEVYALRAYYYFNLALMFGHHIPLRLQAVVENKPAVPAEELYAQIGDDLNNALSLLPNKSIQVLGVSGLGRFTRWSVQALAARVYLFYTGYYQKADLPTLSGSITKTQVINWLEDCIANSGHELLPDYRNNYVYGNHLTAPDYKYASDNHLAWVGDEGGNTEAVFVIKYSIFNDNRWGLIFGIRSQSKAATFPFRDGWGAGSVNPMFFEQWLADEPDDIRRNASILDLSDPNEGLNYGWYIDQGEETGYIIKKVQNVNAHDASGNILNFSLLAYGGNDGQAHSAVDQIMVRFSDVLLMHSELTEDAAGLNRVRTRVGLPAVPYSLDALRKERRYELAFDGFRYYDLLRWYGMDAGAVIDANQNGAVSYRTGNAQVLNANLTKRIRDTGGFLEIPKTEIDLSEGVLRQNPGWEGADILFLP
jgi:hypothetical protein